MLKLSGASLEEMLWEVPSGVALSALAGREYGKFLDRTGYSTEERPALERKRFMRTPLNVLKEYTRAVSLATLLVTSGNYAVRNMHLPTEEYRLDLRPELPDGTYCVRNNNRGS